MCVVDEAALAKWHWLAWDEAKRLTPRADRNYADTLRENYSVALAAAWRVLRDRPAAPTPLLRVAMRRRIADNYRAMNQCGTRRRPDAPAFVNYSLFDRYFAAPEGPDHAEALAALAPCTEAERACLWYHVACDLPAAYAAELAGVAGKDVVYQLVKTGLARARGDMPPGKSRRREGGAA